MATEAATWANWTKFARVARPLGPVRALESTDIESDAVCPRCASSDWLLLCFQLQTPKKVLSLFIVEIIEDAGGRVLDRPYSAITIKMFESIGIYWDVLTLLRGTT